MSLHAVSADDRSFACESKVQDAEKSAKACTDAVARTNTSFVSVHVDITLQQLRAGVGRQA
jgi:hypothetical protein